VLAPDIAVLLMMAGVLGLTSSSTSRAVRPGMSARSAWCSASVAMQILPVLLAGLL
jgi:hypothetical protein